MPALRTFSLFLAVCLLLGALVTASIPRRNALAQDTPSTPTEPAVEDSVEGPTVTTTRTANIRSGPGTSYRILGTERAGATFAVTGVNAAGTWWRIDYAGAEGWIFANLVAPAGTEDAPIVLVRARPAAPAAPASAPSPRVNFNPETLQLRLETVYTGLNQPTYATHAGDGSGRMFVTERAGRIKVFAAPPSEGRVFLDIEDRVDDSGPEQGLLGLAFAPDYAQSGRFYVNYTDTQGDTVVARYRVSDDLNAADKESEQQLLWVDQPAPNHNGGMITFGPDGRLWVGLGDGGGANDTFGNGQNPNTFLGKIVRMDVRGDSAAGEIWGTGLRNPWRFSFDAATGDLWIGDVGQSLFEEINYVPAAQVRAGGLNFGWPVMEGAHCRGDGSCNSGEFVPPIYEYGHEGNGCSVTGGSVYRGAALPALQGVYLYGDFCSGNIWALWRGAGDAMQNARVLPNAAAVSSFAEDEAGELYVVDIGGAIHRIVAAP
jgi:glucose/arabinose dehydrogenase